MKIEFIKSVVDSVRGDGGQALLETALTLPMLALMLLGAFEFSRVAYSAIEVTNAARAAAQYGAMNGGGFLDTSGMLAAANADAGNLSGLSWVSGYPTVACSCSGTTQDASCPSGKSPSGCASSQLLVTVNVQLKFQMSSVLKVPGFPTNYTVYGNASKGVLQ
jgi:Flp pilus assembly protein TadG